MLKQQRTDTLHYIRQSFKSILYKSNWIVENIYFRNIEEKF